MTSFDRKLKRTASRKMAKEIKRNMGNLLNQQIESKMKAFSRIPDECQTCAKPFDKKSREQVFSWMMEINKEEEVYNLFCPSCYEGDLKNREVVEDE